MRGRGLRRAGFLSSVAGGLILVAFGLNGVAGIDGRLEAVSGEGARPASVLQQEPAGGGYADSSGERSVGDGWCRDREKRRGRSRESDSSL
jgi:hypothetical protein